MSTKIGDRIRYLRQQNNLTQLELAKKLNIGNSTLSQYESGARVPSDEIKKNIAEIFDVSIDYLLGISNLKKSNTKSITESNDRLIKDALADSGLLDIDGKLTDEGAEVVADFIRSNADMLKKLIDKK